jgi:pilus assembly protein Flp/PilA
MGKKLTMVWSYLVALHREESGQDLIEYALIAALIALGSIIGMDTVANEINSAFNIISKKLANAVS